MKLLGFLSSLMDAILALAVYFAGRRDAALSTAKEELRRVEQAKRVEERMAGDAGYAAGVRKRFTRK